VDGSAQIAVGGQLQQFANIDHKAAGQRHGVDPLSGRHLNLQPFLLVLQQEAEETGIFMGANALAALGLLLAGIADQLDMLVGLVAVKPVKGILRELQLRQRRAAGGSPPESSAVASEVIPVLAMAARQATDSDPAGAASAARRR
jgi:hypothetical protein